MFSKSISYTLLLTSTLGLTLLLNACGEGASGPGISPGDAINIIDRKPNYTCDTSNINQKIPTDNNNKITQDTTIGPGCFYANNYVFIDDGAQLTINPDTILQFKTLTGLVVDNGNINANGLPDKPIYFTGEFKTENTAWTGIMIRGRSQSFRPNIFNYTLNEYSGARRPKTTEDDSASISFNDTLTNQKNDQKPRIIFTNNVIRKSSGKYAFNASNYSFFDKIENNIFYDNLFYPVSIDVNESFKLNQSNRFSYNGIPNAINKLVINGDILDVFDRKEAHSAYEDPNALPITTITWKNLGIPYVIHSNIKVTSTILTIEPGTKLEFRQNAGLSIIGSNAAMVSTGTPTAPITMTSEDLQLPEWHGLTYFQSNKSINTLEYTHITGAGAGLNEAKETNAAVSLTRESTVKIRHSSLMNSVGYGLYVDGTSSLPEFQNNQLIGNFAGIANISPLSLHFLLPQNTYGNPIANLDQRTTTDTINLIGDELTNTHVHTIKNLNVPYIIQTDMEVSGDLTIEPGTVMLFEENTQLHITENATLNATGTAGAPIIFSDASRLNPNSFSRAYWRGLYFNQNTFPSPQNRMSYVNIDHAGRPDSNGQGAIKLTANASLTIDHSTIQELWQGSPSIDNPTNVIQGEGNFFF